MPFIPSLIQALNHLISNNAFKHPILLTKHKVLNYRTYAVDGK